jgi:hypothetical protein
MVKEKKPTIYSDRGTIGSSDELDEYGVWVKSEPQDLSESLPEASPEFDSDDPFGPEPASDAPDLKIPDIEILPDFGTSESDKEGLDASGFADPPENEEPWDIPDIDDVASDSKDIDSAAIQDIQIDDYEFEPLDLPSDDLSEEVAKEESVEAEEDSVEFNINDETVPDDFSEVALDAPSDLLDSDPLDSDSSDQDTLDSSLIDFSAPIDEPEPAEESGSFIESSSFTESSSQSPAVSELSNQLLLRIAEELSSIRAELTSLKKDFAGMKAESQPQEREHGFFNEEEDETIALTGDELSTILNVEAKDVSDISAEVSEDTAGILKIEETPLTVETKAPEHGFFDDEEDETIALTGDELNNILNTAEFTEETGTDVAVEEIGLPDETDTLSEDLSIEELPSEELLSEELPLEELSSEELPSEDFSPENLPLDELAVEEFALNEIPIEETSKEDAVEALAVEEPEMISLDEITSDLDLGTGLEEINLDESSEEEPLIEFVEPDEATVIDLDESIVLDEPVELDVSFDTSPTESLVLDESVELPESVELDESLGASLELEEFAIPEPVENDGLPDFNISAENEIIELSETGVSPMTPAPEDTSFLDEEVPAAIDELSIDDTVEEIEFDEASDEPSIDLSTAVIDEPDLSMDIQDNPIEEPSLENISIDLDLDESSMSEEAEDDAAVGLGSDNITLDLEEEIDILEGTEELTNVELSDMESSDFQSGDIESSDIESSDIESVDIQSVDFQSEEEVSISPEVFDLDEEETAITEAPAEVADDELALIPEAFTGDVSEDQIPLEESPDEETILEDDIFSQDEIPEPKAKAVPLEDTPDIPVHLKQELKAVLSYMDKLLESLPDEKIEEFAKSDYFDTYKKLFSELGLI